MYQILKYNLSFDTILNDMMDQQDQRQQVFAANTGNNVWVTVGWRTT